MNQVATKTSQGIQKWLISWLCEELNVEAQEIDVNEPFVNLGVSSRQAVVLMGDLENWLGFEIDPSLAWEYPTIQDLSEYLINPNDDEDFN